MPDVPDFGEMINWELLYRHLSTVEEEKRALEARVLKLEQANDKKAKC